MGECFKLYSKPAAYALVLRHFAQRGSIPSALRFRPEIREDFRIYLPNGGAVDGEVWLPGPRVLPYNTQRRAHKTPVFKYAPILYGSERYRRGRNGHSYPVKSHIARRKTAYVDEQRGHLLARCAYEYIASVNVHAAPSFNVSCYDNTICAEACQAPLPYCTAF